MRVLFADDDADIADMSRRLLELAGHQVQVARDGREAVRLAKTFRPSVAILDISMPGLTGFEAALKIRGILPRAKLVAISGWPIAEREDEFRLMGFDQTAQKPVDVTRLCRELEADAGQ